MRYLLLIVALATVVATGRRVGASRASAGDQQRTADFVPLPPHLG